MEDCIKFEEDETAVFRGYDNHTLRQTFIYRPVEPVLTRRSKRMNGDSGAIEVPLTEIDEYFDDGFVVGNNAFCAQHTERPLNSRALWEEVEAKLHAIAVKTETSYSRYYGIKKTFHIPVTSTWLLPNNRTSNTEDNWLFWKGKYYDPNFIYTLHFGGGNATATELLPLCPLRVGRLSSVVSDLNPDTESEDGSTLLQSSYYDECHGVEHLEIDLGSTCHVTRLVSTGCYPTNLKSFPKMHNNCRGLRGHDRNRMHEKRKGLRRKQVWVVDDTSTLSWVTRYEVLYRTAKGKWQKHGSILDGNVDVATEKSHAVDFTARYVRIIPLDCHVRKAMTVGVYGIGAPSPKESMDVAVKTEQSNEVVIYELETPQTCNLRAISGYSFRSDRLDKIKRNARRQTEMKKDLRYTIQHDL